MTREIKFRAWDKTAQKYVESKSLAMMLNGTYIFDEEGAVNQSDVEIEQYTGIKDANGVEIYEGDILKDPDGGFVVGAVEMDDYFQWVCGGDFLFDCSYCEVIGNIHEDTYLLEEG